VLTVDVDASTLEAPSKEQLAHREGFTAIEELLDEDMKASVRRSEDRAVEAHRKKDNALPRISDYQHVEVLVNNDDTAEATRIEIMEEVNRVAEVDSLSRLVLTNDKPWGLEEDEFDIIDVNYRHNIFPKVSVSRSRTDDNLWEPIRILAYFDLRNLDSHTQEYLQHVVIAAVKYLEKLIRVERVDGKLIISGSKSMCGYVTIPDRHRTVGIDADVVIYVTATQNSDWCQGVYAFAGTCKRDRSKRRPVAGFINYCSFSSGQRRRRWRTEIEIAVHEMSHSLFFLTSHYRF